MKTKAERQAATRAAVKCWCGNVVPLRNAANEEPLCGGCEAAVERAREAETSSPLARAIAALEAISDNARAGNEDDLGILTLAEDALAELRDPSTGKPWGLT